MFATAVRLLQDYTQAHKEEEEEEAEEEQNEQQSYISTMARHEQRTGAVQCHITRSALVLLCAPVAFGMAVNDEKRAGDGSVAVCAREARRVIHYAFDLGGTLGQRHIQAAFALHIVSIIIIIINQW